jgi:Wzt-like putative exopolysaccharide export protein
LIIDEILAVGDSRFQQKCVERLTAFRKTGKTLILTSHDLTQIQNLCDEVLVLEEGRLVSRGEPESALRCYHDLMRQRTEKRASELYGDAALLSLPVTAGFRQGTQEATISAVRLYNAHGQTTDHLSSGESLTVELEYLLTKPLSDMALNLGFFNEAHVKCFEAAIPSIRSAFGNLSTRGVLRCHFPGLPLMAGLYYVNMGLFPLQWEYVYDSHWQMHPLLIVDEPGMPSQGSGIVSLRPRWSVLTPHGD